MTWRYRCERCEMTSPAVADRQAAEQLRDRHRDVVHGGLIPDAEEMWPETGLSLPARRMLIGMGVGSAVLLIARWLGG